jgi:hypothetical protein
MNGVDKRERQRNGKNHLTVVNAFYSAHERFFLKMAGSADFQLPKPNPLVPAEPDKVEFRPEWRRCRAVIGKPP